MDDLIIIPEGYKSEGHIKQTIINADRKYFSGYFILFRINFQIKI